MSTERFEWDDAKDSANQAKHGISFDEARHAFADPNRVIVEDVAHSTEAESRYYCIGRIARGIVSVRFTFRKGRIRIIGAGFWRQDRRIYEAENNLH